MALDTLSYAVMYKEFLFNFLIYWLDGLGKSRADICVLVNMVSRTHQRHVTIT